MVPAEPRRPVSRLLNPCSQPEPPRTAQAQPGAAFPLFFPFHRPPLCLDPASFLIRWGCARLRSVPPGHGLHGPRAPQLRALWLWSSTATGLSSHAGAKRSAGVPHPLPKMTGMKEGHLPDMDGWCQAVSFSGQKLRPFF